MRPEQPTARNGCLQQCISWGAPPQAELHGFIHVRPSMPLQSRPRPAGTAASLITALVPQDMPTESINVRQALHLDVGGGHHIGLLAAGAALLLVRHVEHVVIVPQRVRLRLSKCRLKIAEFLCLVASCRHGGLDSLSCRGAAGLCLAVVEVRNPSDFADMRCWAYRRAS